MAKQTTLSVAAAALLSGAVLAALPGGVPASAQTALNAMDGKAIAAPAEQGIAVVDDLVLAHRLAVYGAANKDALALIVAARITDSHTAWPAELQPRDVADAKTAEEPAGSAPDLSDVAGMLAVARELAGGRADLVGLIEDVEAGGDRGTYGLGYYYYEDNVEPLGGRVYDELFIGSERALVALDGWYGHDLDLMVLDEFGGVVCDSASMWGSERCEWTPRWTGRFTVRVSNNADAEATYSLWTN